MSDFKRLGTLEGEKIVNIDNIDYIDTYGKTTRMVMGSGSVYKFSETVDEVLAMISTEVVISKDKPVFEIDKNIIHTKKGKKNNGKNYKNS